MLGHVKAKLWAIDIVHGEVTMVRFIWPSQRYEYLKEHPAARSVDNIQQCGTDGNLYDTTQGKEI